MFGLSPWIAMPLWFILAFGIATIISGLSIHNTGQPRVKPVGFFMGGALGPLALIGVLGPDKRGSKPALLAGGVLGTLVYLRILNVI